MQPRGATKGTKRARQYGRIKDGELERSASESRAEEIPRVPDEERARASPASARGPRPRTSRPRKPLHRDRSGAGEEQISAHMSPATCRGRL